MSRSRSAPPGPSLPDPSSDAAGLRAFIAIARLGTVGRAAPALGRTQPSVSARLLALEAAWGTRLFRRQARGMALTPEGARLLPLAEAALRSLEELDRAAGLPVVATNDLRVGAGDALGRELLPRVLAFLVREDPGLAVRLLEGSAGRLLEALRGGEIDVALVVVPEGQLASEGLDVEFLFETEVELFLPPGTGPRGKGRVPLEYLRGARLVALQPGSGFRRHVEAAFAARGIPFAPAVEVGNLSLVRRFVAAGLGVAPVPAVAFSRSAPGPPVERRGLEGVPPVRYFTVTRSGVPLPGSARRLLETLEEAARGRPRRGAGKNRAR